MTTSQRTAIRISEIRQRLNEIAGLADDAMTDEIRAEADKLTGEFRNAETQHRAALIAEGEEQRQAEGELGDGDGEPSEVRALLGRATLYDYLNPAVAESDSPARPRSSMPRSRSGPSGSRAES